MTERNFRVGIREEISDYKRKTQLAVSYYYILTKKNFFKV